jgi:hypothetical protein
LAVLSEVVDTEITYSSSGTCGCHCPVSILDLPCLSSAINSESVLSSFQDVNAVLVPTGTQDQVAARRSGCI